jgi:hypothetical protein
MPSTVNKLQRIALGLIVAVFVLLVVDAIPMPFASKSVEYRLFGSFYVWPAVYGLLTTFVAAFAGAIVARVNFIGPAVLLAVVAWVLTVYFLGSIATAAGQDLLFEAAATNIIGLLLSIVGAVFGALTGRRFFKTGVQNATTAA